VNCSLCPAATEAVVGVTEIEVNTGAVTVRFAAPLIVPDLAVMVALPWAKLVASPALLTVATEVFEDVQVAVLVRLCVVPLLYVPVAVNCCVAPAIMEGVAGITATETSDGAVPVPVSVTVCGLEVPVSVIVRVPAREPVVLGVKDTEIVQLAPAASVAGLTGQVLLVA
jgi:hypothetical protein